MKIKWGALVVDGRGKIGGQVASKNRAGAYMRTKVTPVNPQTSAQTAVRVLFATISQQWSGLSAAARAAWNEAVAEWSKTDIFGDLKTLSGKALFQRLNNQAQSAGYAAVTSAPTKLEMVSGVITAAAMSTGSGTFSLTGAYAGADARVQIFATPALSAGTTFVKNKLRQIYSPVANALVEIDASDAYVNKYGNLTGGENVYFGVKYVLPNGQASPMQIIKVLIGV